MNLYSVPDSLIIQPFGNKKFVKYNAKLDLTDFVISERADKKKVLYRLCGVIELSGEYPSNHYSAHIRVVQPGNASGKWYFFDNSEVSEVDEQSAINKDNCILIYQRIMDDL